MIHVAEKVPFGILCGKRTCEEAVGEGLLQDSPGICPRYDILPIVECLPLLFLR